MFPAFRDNRQAALFCALMAFALLLPVLLAAIGPPPRQQAYAAMTREAGPVAQIIHTIFEETSDAEIVFLGSSLVRSGIDLDMVRKALTGPPTDAHVESLALNWHGLDLQYVMLRDLLEHRRARLVIWNMPIAEARSDRPHVQAFRWLRHGEFRDATAGLPYPSQAALYGASVLGAPRQFLSLIRPNRLFPRELEEDERSKAAAQGYYGARFIPEDAVPPAHPEGPVRLSGPPLGPYNLHFARLIADLLAQRDIPLVFLHIPVDSELGDSTMPERMDWPQILGVDAPVIGAASAALFPGLSPERVLNFYFDQHFNRNGQRLYTAAMIPDILRVYGNATRTR